MFKNIDSAEFEKRIAEDENAVILDVRTPAELADGSIEGHMMIDFNNGDFYGEVEKMDAAKSYYVYCRSGMRSMRACMIMSDHDIETLYNLEGGIQAWNAYQQAK